MAVGTFPLCFLHSKDTRQMLPTRHIHSRYSHSTLTGQAKKQSDHDGSASRRAVRHSHVCHCSRLCVPLVGEAACRKEIEVRISSGVPCQTTWRGARHSASAARERTRRSIRGSFTFGAARGWSWRRLPRAWGPPLFVGALLRLRRTQIISRICADVPACVLVHQAPSPFAVASWQRMVRLASVARDVFQTREAL